MTPHNLFLLTNFLFSLFRHEGKYNTLLRVYANCNDQHCASAFHYLRRKGEEEGEGESERVRGRERGRERLTVNYKYYIDKYYCKF